VEERSSAAAKEERGGNQHCCQPDPGSPAAGSPPSALVSITRLQQQSRYAVDLVPLGEVQIGTTVSDIRSQRRRSEPVVAFTIRSWCTRHGCWIAEPGDTDQGASAAIPQPASLVGLAAMLIAAALFFAAAEERLLHKTALRQELTRSR